MRISALINQLQVAQEQLGDLDIRGYSHEAGEEYPLDSLADIFLGADEQAEYKLDESTLYIVSF